MERKVGGVSGQEGGVALIGEIAVAVQDDGWEWWLLCALRGGKDSSVLVLEVEFLLYLIVFIMYLFGLMVICCSGFCLGMYAVRSLLAKTLTLSVISPVA